ncbi:MAG: hypothetical protein K6C97_10140 [Treponema sp.]|nr:hypothetical protein [Treponema sp.]
MMDANILLFIIKLVLGGIVAFLAILLMSKTRDGAWMAMVGGFIIQYAVLVFDLLVKLGVLTSFGPEVFGIPLSSLLCALLPSLCFILALILMLCKRQ